MKPSSGETGAVNSKTGPRSTNPETKPAKRTAGMASGCQERLAFTAHIFPGSILPENGKRSLSAESRVAGSLGLCGFIVEESKSYQTRGEREIAPYLDHVFQTFRQGGVGLMGPPEMRVENLEFRCGGSSIGPPQTCPSPFWYLPPAIGNRTLCRNSALRLF